MPVMVFLLYVMIVAEIVGVASAAKNVGKSFTAEASHSLVVFLSVPTEASRQSTGCTEPGLTCAAKVSRRACTV